MGLNQVKDQVFRGSDLEGDGVLSPREEVIKLNASQTMEYNMSDAQEAMDKVSGLLKNNGPSVTTA